MFNHPSGAAVFDLIYQLAVLSGWVVLPVGCPVCVTDPDRVPALPADLVADVGVAVIGSGADLLRLVSRPDPHLPRSLS